MDTYLFPDVTGEIHSYWLMGVTGGQLLNGHFGYVEIAPESTLDLFVCEFERYLPILRYVDYAIYNEEFLN